jgi:hypothetical protein
MQMLVKVHWIDFIQLFSPPILTCTAESAIALSIRRIRHLPENQIQHCRAFQWCSDKQTREGCGMPRKMPWAVKSTDTPLWRHYPFGVTVHMRSPAPNRAVTNSSVKLWGGSCTHPIPPSSSPAGPFICQARTNALLLKRHSWRQMDPRCGVRASDYPAQCWSCCIADGTGMLHRCSAGVGRPVALFCALVCREALSCTITASLQRKTRTQPCAKGGPISGHVQWPLPP